MKPFTVQEFAESCGGFVTNVDGAANITGFATDSRDVQKGDLFL